MSSFEINIQHWCAWTPGLETEEDWRAWAQGTRNPGEPGKPNLSAFPAMLRRRLSQTGKMALHSLLALDRADTAQDIPAVFCSQYGEVIRSSKLLSALGQDQPLSPTDFSLSVHNAVAGVYSIGCNQTQNITAMSAGQGGFTLAMLEAKGILEASDHQHVLCVIYDAPLPEPYPETMNECVFPYALALLLSANDSMERIRVSLIEDARQEVPHQFAPAALLHFLLDKQTTSVRLSSGNALWHYQRLGSA